MKVTYFSNARTALKSSLLDNNFVPKDIILVPDLICDSILIPMNQLKLKLVFYSTNESFSPDWNELIKLIKLNNAKAVLMIHYFGQPKNLSKFIDFSIKNNLILIEDNAHGYGGKFNGKVLGHFGDIGISSPRKTLNLPSGGVLYSNLKTKSLIKLNSFPLYKPKFFIKIILYFSIYFYNKIRYFLYKDSNWNDPYLFKTSIEKDYKIDFISKYTIKSTNWDKVAINRRNNWNLWCNFAKKNGLVPVYNDLSSESCPWALPLLAKDINERNQWINWGLENNIHIFMWPSLPKNIIENEDNAFKIWKRLICISLDIPPNLSYNENKNL